MEIKDLGHDEQLALVALVEFIAEANPEITDRESDEIARIADRIGSDRYRELISEVDERFANEAALREFLATVRRQEARELIFGEALGLAMGDTIQGSESDLLEWLSGEWGVEIVYGAPDADE